VFCQIAGWGPVVRTLPIVSRLVDHGIASSVAIGTIGPERAADFDHRDQPALTCGRIRPANGEPYHFLAHHDLDIIRCCIT
jgi:hypothetical protein